jgi:hypothetical protein
MKRYLITNPRYTGEVEVIYNPEGVLQQIDFGQTNLQPLAIQSLKNAIPSLEDRLKAFTAETIIVQENFVITFQMFWKKYDHKFNAARCEKLWEKLKATDKVLAYYGLDKYHKHLRKNPTQFKMHPDTYLRNGAWENDYK